jgi:hypothetical protein
MIIDSIVTSRNACASSCEKSRAERRPNGRSGRRRRADIFALNQHVTQREQEDLFVMRGAMFQSDRLLLSLDQYGAALGRMWCVFEIWTAAQVSQPEACGPLTPDSTTHRVLRSAPTRDSTGLADGGVHTPRQVASSVGRHPRPQGISTW